MFRRLKVRGAHRTVAPDPLQVSIQQIVGDASLPVSIRAVNNLPENAKRRLYRVLAPISLLTRFDISPRTWKGSDGEPRVRLEAKPDSGSVVLSAWHGEDPADPYFHLELADNSFNGIDLKFLILNDPTAQRFATDVDEEGLMTEFGTVRRHLKAEEEAMTAGLAPGQVRRGLGASGLTFEHIETFLTLLAHHALFLEPLTYTSAWVFERRGFAYVRGHQMMDLIHNEFQPGGRLHQALNGRTRFRQPDQWNTIRGRSWAIHDGVLETLGARWDGLRMVKQVGRHANVDTSPGVAY